jgi:hypothetical protein
MTRISGYKVQYLSTADEHDTWYDTGREFRRRKDAQAYADSCQRHPSNRDKRSWPIRNYRIKPIWK